MKTPCIGEKVRFEPIVGEGATAPLAPLPTRALCYDFDCTANVFQWKQVTFSVQSQAQRGLKILLNESGSVLGLKQYIYRFQRAARKNVLNVIWIQAPSCQDYYYAVVQLAIWLLIIRDLSWKENLWIQHATAYKKFKK